MLSEHGKVRYIHEKVVLQQAPEQLISGAGMGQQLMCTIVPGRLQLCTTAA